MKGSQSQLEEYARVATLCQPPQSLTMKKSAQPRRKKKPPGKGFAVNIDLTSCQVEYACGVVIPADLRHNADTPMTLDCIQRILFDKVSSAGEKLEAESKLWNV